MNAQNQFTTAACDVRNPEHRPPGSHHAQQLAPQSSANSLNASSAHNRWTCFSRVASHSSDLGVQKYWNRQKTEKQLRWSITDLTEQPFSTKTQNALEKITQNNVLIPWVEENYSPNPSFESAIKVGSVIGGYLPRQRGLWVRKT